jgi:hypothetical protein
MKGHRLFFEKFAWLGEGKISVTMSKEALKFYARWSISKASATECCFVQEVEIDEMLEKMENRLRFYDFNEEEFKVELENNVWGKVLGQGTVNDSVIAWEFRDQEANVEGFEVYEIKKEGGYLLRAEYMSSDNYRTMIEGELWEVS